MATARTARTSKARSTGAKTAKVKPTSKTQRASKTERATPGAGQGRKVVLAGIRGAGVTSLVRALAPTGVDRSSAIVDPFSDPVASRKAKRPKVAPPSLVERAATLKGKRIVLLDTPGIRLRKNADDDVGSEPEFGLLLTALGQADVIVNVVPADHPDAERAGAELDRWVYGSGHDERAGVVVALIRVDLAPRATVDALRSVWPDAIAVSSKSGKGVSELASAIARARANKVQPPKGPLARKSLLDLQLDLLRRTSVGALDGARVAADLASARSKGKVSGFVFLREARAKLTRKGHEREGDGLRFLGRMHEDVWDADTLHVLCKKTADAKTIVTLAETQWGAGDVTLVGNKIVRAVWKIDAAAPRRRIASRLGATVRDVQLEIVARTGFNAFRGERVAAALRESDKLVRAVALGRSRLELPNDGGLFQPWLNTVEEIGEGYWNADTLWVVAANREAEERLRFLAETHWFADSVEVLRGAEAKRVAGVAPPCSVLELWWD